MPDLDQLLEARGTVFDFGAYVTAACFDSSGLMGFALGDGTIRAGRGAALRTLAVHEGAVLAMSAHPGGGFISGGDDGKFLNIRPDGVAEAMGSYGGKWVEHTAAFPGRTGYLAAAVGKQVHLFTVQGEKLRSFTHPSTVTGIAFDAKGKRLAASHYNGASLWFAGSNSEVPRLLEWKGSHIGVALHPAMDALVTAMQENSLHGWTLPEGKHMRMAGYPAKTESFGFTKSGKWLATGGADTLVLWPFFGGGPMGKPPKELGAADGIIKRIACHPDYDVVAVGFDSGLVTIIDIQKEKILPVCGPGRGAISALAWGVGGAELALGTESGFAALVDLSVQT